MPASGRGANLDTSRRVGTPKGIPKAPPKPLPKAPVKPAPKAQAFSPTLQKTFAPLGKQVGAPSKLGSPKNQREGAKTSHSLLSEVGKGIGEGASTAGHVINLLAQARSPEGGTAARQELARPIEKVNRGLQSRGTAQTVASGLRSAGINIPQHTLEQVTKSLGRLPEDVAYMPRGTVESIIKPQKGAEQFGKLVKETVEHPSEHADFITLMGVPFLNKAARSSKIVGEGEATGVGDTSVRPMARNQAPLRKPSLQPQGEKNLAKRVLGGPIRAGRVDYHAGSQRQLEHLQRITDENAMKPHTSKSKAVNEAIVPYGEGLIKPSDRVGSATKRIAHIRERYEGLSDKQKLEADRQISVYEKIKNFTPKQHEEALKLAEGHRSYQAPKSLQAAYEGAIQPQQLRARYMGFALTHGHELGGGELRIRKGAVSPLIDSLREANDKIAEARTQFEKTKAPAAAKQLRARVADLEDHRAAIEAQLHDSHGADAVKKLKIKEGRISTEKGSGVLHDHLVDANNEHVPWSQIEDLYYSHGHKNPPLYVSQTSKAMSSGGPGKVRGIPRYAKPRSGINVQRGTYDTTLENLRRSNVGMGNTIAKAQGKRALYRRFGHGEFKTPEAGEKAVKEFNNDPANKEFIDHYGLMVRTSRGPARFLHSPAGREGPHWLDKGIDAQAQGNGGPGKFTMMPQKILDRLGAHEKTEALAREPWSSPLGVLSKSTTAFRKAVLILNPHWWAGVPMEYMVRGLMGNRVGMRKLGGEMMDRWQEVADNPSMPSHLRYEATKNIASFNQGKTLGGWVGDLMESNNINDIMRPQQSKWGALMDRTPKGLRLWRGAQGGVAKWLHYIEETNNKKILGQIAHDQIKQTVKETRDLTDDMGKFREKWAEGKLNPNEGDDLVERLVRIAGNWHHLTPTLKQMRMYVLPFGMWTVNALSYMLKVMPRDYPGRSMLIVALSQAAPREHLPLYLQGTLPSMSIGGHQVRPDPFYYLPTSLGREIAGEKGQLHLGVLESTTPLLGAAALSEGSAKKFAEGVGESVVPAAGQTKRAVEARQGPLIGALKAFGPVRLTSPSKKEEEEKGKSKGSFGKGSFKGGGYGGGFGGKF